MIVVSQRLQWRSGARGVRILSLCLIFMLGGRLVLGQDDVLAEKMKAMQERMDHQAKQIDALMKHISNLEREKAVEADANARKLEALRQRVQDLEGKKSGVQPSFAVDLSDSSDSLLSALPDTLAVASRPWFENLRISGFAAVGFMKTGSSGTREEGGFEVIESALHVDAELWEDHSLFMEIMTDRLGKDSLGRMYTGEMYLRWDNLLENWHGLNMGMKVGRIDIPFGEEYLWQDAIDNPLITTSAAFPYGFDEGLLLFGDYGALDWIVSVTDGDGCAEQRGSFEQGL